MVKDLSQLVDKLKQAAGSNLKSVVLYGSAASGEFQPRHSDLNVLCVLERLGASEIDRFNPAAIWWVRKGHPAPLLFTLEELRSSADVFAIELLDIRASRRMLFGEDVFAQLDVPMDLHRQQVERELRTNLIRLRQGYLAAARNNSTLFGLMSASISTFVTLFRHALLVLGEQPLPSKRGIVDRLAGLLSFDASGFHAVFDVREGRQKQSQLDVMGTFSAYLAAVTRVADEIDRRLAVGK